MTTGKVKYQSPVYKTGPQQVPRKPCGHVSQQVLPGRTVTKRVCNICHKVLENIYPSDEGKFE